MSADGSAVGRVMQVEVNVRVGGNQPGCVVRPIVRNRVAGHVGILFAATQAQPGNHGLLKWLAWNGDQVCVAPYSLPNRLVIFHIGGVRYERNADVMHHSRIHGLELHRRNPGVLGEVSRSEEHTSELQTQSKYLL